MSDGKKQPAKKRDLRKATEVTSPAAKPARGPPSRTPAPPQEGQPWKGSFTPVTQEMIRREKTLRNHSLVGNIIGPRMVPPEDVKQAICAQLNVPSTLVRVCRSHSSDYLLAFASRAMAKEMNEQRIVTGPGFKVVVWPWNRKDDSDEVHSYTKVEIKIQGIPPHAWHQGTVHSLLDDYCVIESIEMARFLNGDMSSVRVTALTSSPDRIPPTTYLTIPEPSVGEDLCLTPCPVPPTMSVTSQNYPIIFTTRRIPSYSLPINDAREETKEEYNSDSAPSGAFDYSSPSPPGSLETGYDYDSDREPAGWK